jgi:hypothetical protein
LKRTLEGGVVVFISSAWHPSPRKSTSPPALLSGSDAKNSTAKLSSFASDDVGEFDVADIMLLGPWVSRTRGGRGGSLGGRVGGELRTKLMVEFGSWVFLW